MNPIKYKQSAIICVSLILISISGFIPSIIAGRPGGGGGGYGIGYPWLYLKNGQTTTADIDHFRSIDGQIISWYEGWMLSTTIWIERPDCAAGKGNSVQMKLKFSASGWYVLNMRIYFWDGSNQWWSYTGPENTWTTALATIPDYDAVEYITFDIFGGYPRLKIDYLAACYPNIDMGIEPVNFFLIEEIPGPFPDW